MKRAKLAAMSLAVVLLFGYTSVSLTTGAYDYAMAAPCRDGLTAALEQRKADWDEVNPNTTLQRLAMAYHGVFTKFRDRVAALSCPIRAESTKARALTAIDEYLDVLAAIARYGEFDDVTYSQAQDKEAKAVAALQGVVGE